MPNRTVHDGESLANGAKAIAAGIVAVIVSFIGSSLESTARTCSTVLGQLEQREDTGLMAKCFTSEILFDGKSWFLWGGVAFIIGGAVLCALSFVNNESDDE